MTITKQALLGASHFTGDISTEDLEHLTNQFDFSSQDTTVVSIFIRDGGSQLFMLGEDNKTVYEYIMNRPYDLFDMVYSGNSVLVPNAGSSNLRGLEFSVGGSLIIIGESTNSGRVQTFDLDTNWDITSLNAGSVQTYVSSLSGLRGIRYNPDGTEFFMSNNASPDTLTQLTLGTVYDLSDITATKTTNLDSSNSSPQNFVFSEDGTRVYVTDFTDDIIYQYDLADSFDITTLTLTGQSIPMVLFAEEMRAIFKGPNYSSFYIVGSATDAIITQLDVISSPNVTSQDPNIDVHTFSGFTVTSLEFAPDGSRLAVVDGAQGVYDVSLSTNWVLASGTTSPVTTLSEVSSLTSIKFDITGTRMYAVSSGDDIIYQYDLSGNFNATTATYSGKALDVNLSGTVPGDMAISKDGRNVFVFSLVDNSFYQYELTTPYDISTGVYTGNFLNVTTEVTDPQRIFLDFSETKMFLTDRAGTEQVKEYAMNDPNDISQCTLTRNISLTDVPQISGVYIRNDFVVLFATTTGDGQAKSTDLNKSVDITTVWFNQRQLNVEPLDNSPQGVAISEDGRYLFMIGNQLNLIFRFDLFKPFQASSGVQIQLFSVGAQEVTPLGLTMTRDGTKFYIIGDARIIYEYDMTTPFDLNTASFSGNSLDVTTEDGNIDGLSLSEDGTELFFVGIDNDIVVHYTLSIAFDISTGAFVENFDISSQDTTPRDIFMSPSGVRFAVLGEQNLQIFIYKTITPFSLAGAIYTGLSFDISFTTNPRGLTYSRDNKYCYFSQNVSGAVPHFIFQLVND